MAELISVIVATYNRPDALDAVLRSLSTQSDPDFEVIVGDDGSAPPTRAVSESWRGRVGRRVNHVWHEDHGFRLAEIRNRAILAAQGQYLVFLDGDCMARPDFIATHRNLSERGTFVTGNRVLLSEKLTAKILRDKLQAEHWSFVRWFGERLSGGINRLAALLRLPLGLLRKLRQRQWRGARGSNMAVWRSDLERVDGFDAAFTGWGREDSDFFIRLMRAGITRKDGNFATAVLHLWHREADRAGLSENERKLDAVLASERVRAERGLSALG